MTRIFFIDANNCIKGSPLHITGKSLIPVGLGVEAARRRFRLSLTRAAELVRMLLEARDERLRDYARMPRSFNGDEWHPLSGGYRGQPAPYNGPSAEMPHPLGRELHSLGSPAAARSTRVPLISRPLESASKR